MNPILAFFKKNTSYLIALGIALLAVVILFVTLITKNNGDNNQSSSNLIVNNTNQTTAEQTTLYEPQPDDNEIGAEIPDEETSEGETTTEEQTTTPPVPIDYKYALRVNTYTNCVTVFTKDENGKFTVPYKAMVCSAGRNDWTPLGTFNTTVWYKWCRMVDWTYSQYSYRIRGSIMFHSTPCALNLTLNGSTPSPYYSKGRVEIVEFNKLGQNASLGCVRLTVADAKWIVENCPAGTTTTIVSEPTDPLPKPEVIKIPENIPPECGGYVDTLMPEDHTVKPIKWVIKRIYVAWDPTDPDPANPWHKYSSSITCDATLSVEKGSSLDDIKKLITAKDTCGNVINEKLIITGTYDLEKTGSYTLNLSVTDALGRKATKTVTLKVTENSEATTENSTSSDESSSVTDESSSTNETATSDTTVEVSTTTENSDNTETSTEDETTTEGDTSGETQTTPGTPDSAGADDSEPIA